jgi:hypothetical protein
VDELRGDAFDGDAGGGEVLAEFGEAEFGECGGAVMDEHDAKKRAPCETRQSDVWRQGKTKNVAFGMMIGMPEPGTPVS